MHEVMHEDVLEGVLVRMSRHGVLPRGNRSLPLK